MAHNQHLVPEIILNLVDQYRKATGQNERYVLEDRLRAIVLCINNALNEQQPKETPRHIGLKT